MRSNFLLLVIGSLVGLLFGALVGGSWMLYHRFTHAGSEFSSLEELRESMDGATDGADERDVKDGGNVSLRRIVKAHPSDEIIYTLAPNINVKFQDVPVRTNSFGMRGPETTVEKPQNTFRVVLLGDSFAFGWGVEEEKTFARVLERELLKKIAGTETSTGKSTDKTADKSTGKMSGIKNVEVLDFGVPGYSTFQEVAQFEEAGLKFKPDAVVVYFVNNDFGLPFFVRDMQNGGGGIVNVVNYVKRAWKDDDPKVIEQRKHIQKILNPNRGLEKLSELGQANGFDVFLAINPSRTWDKERKRLSVADRTPNIHVLPMLTRYRELVAERGIPKDRLKLKSDPHPSAEKHQILGEVLAEGVFDWLKL